MKISPINNYILNFNNVRSTVPRSFVNTQINDTYGFSLGNKNNSTPYFCGFLDKFKKYTTERSRSFIKHYQKDFQRFLKPTFPHRILKMLFLPKNLKI